MSLAFNAWHSQYYYISSTPGCTMVSHWLYWECYSFCDHKKCWCYSMWSHWCDGSGVCDHKCNTCIVWGNIAPPSNGV